MHLEVFQRAFQVFLMAGSPLNSLIKKTPTVIGQAPTCLFYVLGVSEENKGSKPEIAQEK